MSEVRFLNVEKIYQNGVQAVTALNLAIRSGEFLCILGPSGCGKSSTLRMLAGLENVTAGKIFVNGIDVTTVPAERRDMAMVFENYALYPHLNVFDNIAMPLVARKLPRPEIETKVRAIAQMLELEPYLTRKVTILSGGQKQRVSIGRALVRSPRALLLDEPLGHLETYMRGRLRTEIRRLQERLGVTTVLITHDQEEAAALGDRVAVMKAGELQQVGTFSDLLLKPKNRFVAEFVGVPPANFFSAEWENDGLRIGETSLPANSQRISLFTGRQGPVDVCVRPDSIRLHSEAAPGRIAGEVRIVEPLGETCNVFVKSNDGDFSAIVPGRQRPKERETVFASFLPEAVLLFDKSGRNVEVDE